MSRVYYTRFNVGDVVGDMLLIERDYDKPDVKRVTRYYCKCQKCGRVKSMTTSALKREVGVTHKACSQGYVKKYPKIYYTWNASVERINNPNDRRYNNYGGRGLTHDFPLFIDFLDYMLPSYLEICDKYESYNITLERIDNNKGYIRGNIRWATQKEQANNRRDNRHIIIKNQITNEKLNFNTFKSCAEFLNINIKTLKRRILKDDLKLGYDIVCVE